MRPFGYPADFVFWLVLYTSLLVHTWCFFKFFPWNRRRRIGLLLGNLLVFASLLGTAALAAESYLRFVLVRTDSFGISLPAWRWFALHVRLNSMGCRDVEWSRVKAAGTRRIAFVGDSFTYGWGVERVEDRFTERLQERFQRQTPGSVQVLNVAKPGWDTSAQVQPIRDLLAEYAVDDIVLCYVFNDVEGSVTKKEGFDPTKPPEPLLFNPLNSCLIDHLYWTLYVPRTPSVRGYFDWLAAAYADASVWKQHQEQLGTILRTCRERGASLRVVLFPFLQTGGRRMDAAAWHHQVREFLEQNGIPTLDLLSLLESVKVQDWVVNRHDAHPNAMAHEQFAKVIWEAFFEPTEP